MATFINVIADIIINNITDEDMRAADEDYALMKEFDMADDPINQIRAEFFIYLFWLMNQDKPDIIEIIDDDDYKEEIQAIIINHLEGIKA